MPRRVVLHVDMDAFFASVAQHDDPSLRGKPVIVGGSANRGVVTAASYEARAFGVRSAMPMYQAMKLCPQATVVRGAFHRYKEVHAQLVAIWGRYAPVIEVASFDEAYLDLTGCEALLGDPVEVAAAIQRDVFAETGVTCSVGVASNKLLAKVASKRNKPRGLCVVPEGDEPAWLAPLAIDDIPGVGPATAARLARIGLHRIHQLQTCDPQDLARGLGDGAEWLVAMAHGRDDRPVEPHGERKSIGAETTFFQDLTRMDELEAVLADLVQEVAFRARRHGTYARTVAVKIRYAGFHTITRARTMAQAMNDDGQIAEVARALLRAHAEPGRPVRLIGVSLSHLGPQVQLSLLDEPRKDQLNEALDKLRDRHGLFVVSRATHLTNERRRKR